MPKIRRVVTLIQEYEPNPDNYPEEYTIEQMADVDDALMQDRDVLGWFIINGYFDITVTHEVIEN